MSETPDLERRLAALEQGRSGPGATRPRRTPLLAVAIVSLILLGGALLVLLLGLLLLTASLSA